MIEFKVMNMVLFIFGLLSIYTIIVRYRSRAEVVVKAKLLNKEKVNNKLVIILLAFCILVLGVSLSLLLYSSIEEFHSTKPFRHEYSIGFNEVINDKEIEKLIDNLEGDQREWGEWSLKKIRQSKTLLIYVINTLLIIVIFPQIASCRIERSGIRKILYITKWRQYSSYYWKDNEIFFFEKGNNRSLKLRIDEKYKTSLDKYLKENTNLIGKSYKK